MFRIRSFAARAALHLGRSLEKKLPIMGSCGEFGEVAIVSLPSNGYSLETGRFVFPFDVRLSAA